MKMYAPLATPVAILLAAGAAFAAPEPADVGDLTLKEGLSLRVYDVGEDMTRLPNLVGAQTGNVNKYIDQPDLGNDDFGLEDRFYAVASGFLVIEEAGEYEFELYSDDGSRLSLGGEMVVNNDGLHSADISGEGYVELRPGTYPIKIEMFDMWVDAALKLTWRTPGSREFVVIPKSALRTEADQVLVTSPGQKQFEIPDGPMEFRRSPGDRRPLEGVHPALTLTGLRPEGFEPKVGGMDFLSDGRLVLCTWDPEGDVYILDGVTGDGVVASDVKVSKFATGLAEPLGVAVMQDDAGKDRIYVLQKQELTELVDNDGDGVADEYRSACSGWPVTDNFHEFAFGLAKKDGLLYANLAVAINPGGQTTQTQAPGRGTCIAIDPIAGTYTTVAAGLRTPNGIGVGVDGELFITDNQGDWLPSSKVLHVQQDAFYNSYINPPHPLSENPVTPPAVWLPHGEIGNSPTNVVLVPDSWGPYAGQQLHADVTHGGVKRVFLEKIDGDYQGAVFRFTQGMEAGTNRIAVGPDQDLYVGGIGSNGDWQDVNAGQWFGLEKLAWTGDVPFEMLTVKPGTNGVEIEFTHPLANGSGESPRGYRLRQYYYEPTSTYGGPKLGQATLDVAGVTISDDRRHAWVELDPATPLKAGHVLHITLRSAGSDAVLAQDDQQPWSTEAWYTMNKLPDRRPDFAGAATTNNPAEKADMTQVEDGFTPLFDGTDASAKANWKGYKKDALPGQWVAEDSALKLQESGGGDIVTRQAYGDFDLRLDWKISEGGNSGIFYRVVEEGDHTDYTFFTGPELQVLDDAKHADARNGTDRLAGALYGLYGVEGPSPVKPAGEWNETRIVIKDNKVEHYLNGQKIVEATIGSDEWNEKIANSKFKQWPRFAKADRGLIGLQDHGDVVWYRNIRIKPLD